MGRTRSLPFQTNDRCTWPVQLWFFMTCLNPSFFSGRKIGLGYLLIAVPKEPPPPSSLLRPLGAAFKIPSVISLWQARRVNAPTLGSDSAVGLRSVRWQGYMVDSVDVILLLYPG